MIIPATKKSRRRDQRQLKYLTEFIWFLSHISSKELIFFYCFKNLFQPYLAVDRIVVNELYFGDEFEPAKVGSELEADVFKV